MLRWTGKGRAELRLEVSHVPWLGHFHLSFFGHKPPHTLTRDSGPRSYSWGTQQIPISHPTRTSGLLSSTSSSGCIDLEFKMRRQQSSEFLPASSRTRSCQAGFLCHCFQHEMFICSLKITFGAIETSLSGSDKSKRVQ